MLEHHLDGFSIEVIAKMYDLTMQRVNQLLLAAQQRSAKIALLKAIHEEPNKVSFDRNVYRLRFGMKDGKIWTYKELAEKFNCSESKISDAINNLSEHLVSFLN